MSTIKRLQLSISFIIIIIIMTTINSSSKKIGLSSSSSQSKKIFKKHHNRNKSNSTRSYNLPIECGWHIFFPNLRSNNKKNVDKISGGIETVLGNFPSFVQVLNFPNDAIEPAICGGAILSKSHILTAAHCVTDKNRNTLNSIFVSTNQHSDTSRESSRKAEKICISPYFQPSISEINHFQPPLSDFAIIKLDRDLILDDYISPACLPSHDLAVDEEVYLTGMGLTESGLRANKLMFRTAYKATYCEGNESTICFIGSGAVTGYSCQGDSGAPAIAVRLGRQEVVGITSWGPTDCYSHYGLSNYVDIWKHKYEIERLVDECS